MKTIFGYLFTAVPGPPVDGGYAHEVTTAVAAATALILALLVIYLVIRATYLILKIFTAVAGHVTAAVFAAVIIIGWLNR